MRIIRTRTALVVAVVLLSSALVSACGGENTATRMARASTYLESGEYRSATIELKNILQDQPKNAQAWFTLGQVSLASGSYADAVHQFQRARDYGNTSQQSDTLLVQALLGERDFNKALEQLHPENAADADSRAAQLVLQGRAYLGLNKPQQAQQAFDAALQAKPDYPPAWVGQARVAWQAGQQQRARQLLTQATTADPTYGRAWVVAGNLAYSQRRCDDVADVFKHMQALGARTVAPVELFSARGHTAFCQLRQGQLEQASTNIDVLIKRGPKNPYANYLKGLLAYLNKDYDQATTYVQKALARAPDNLSGLILSGMIKTAQGDLKSAQLQFTNAVKQAPDSVRARQLLASIYMRRGLPKQAIKVLQEALGADGSNAQVLAQLGEASVRAGQRAEGLQYFEHSAQYADGNTGLQMALAQQMAQAGDADSALALVRQIQSKDDPDTLKFESFKITLYLRNKQPEKAIAEARGLTRDNPGKPQFIRLLARVYAAAGQPEKARNTLQDALKATPGNVDFHLDLGRLAVSTGDYASANTAFQAVLDAHPDNVQAVLALAEGATRQGDDEKATSWLEKAAKLRPDNISIRAKLAQAYLKQKRSADALKVAQSLVADAPDNAQLQQLKSFALMADGQQDAALSSLKKAADLAPESLTIRLNLARLLIAQKQAPEAIRELQAIREQHPDSLAATAMLARLQLQQGHPQVAMDTADSLRHSGNNAAGAYALKGELLQTQQKYKAAAEAYAQAYSAQPSAKLALRLFNVRRLGGMSHPEKPLRAWLNKNPGDTSVMAALAQWYQVSGASDAAAEKYRSLLAIYPSNAFALNNLALIYFSQNDDRALQLAQQAHEAAPDNPAIMDTLGWIQVAAGNVERGLPLLRQAAHSAPSQAQIQYHLAVALSRSKREGSRAEAKQRLTKLLASDHSFDDRANAQELLKTISK